jgi:hypothetical protein
MIAFNTVHAEITWNLSDDGTLTISGKDMPDYDRGDNKAPWSSQRGKIKEIVIENGVTNIGKYAFLNCRSLTSVTIPNSVTKIGSYAFYNCSSLTSVTIPNSVTSIGSAAFRNCSSLTSVTIPNSVTSIGSAAFRNCSSLTSVTIPNSVTSIGEQAFYRCKSLISITFKRINPPYFVVTDRDRAPWYPCLVYVQSVSIEAYKEALEWYIAASDIQANPKQLFLTDDEPYTKDSQSYGVEVSYTRNFTNVNWQAIYLPFSLNYEDLKDDFELAYINTVHQNDNDKDGVIDETVMEIIKMKSGSTQPNMPYLIRAKTAGEKTISAEKTTIYAAESGSVDCSTTIAKYTIIGTYSPIPSETMIANNYYGMGGGKMIQSDGSNGLKPFR